MDSIPLPSVKNQTLTGMSTWGSKAKHFWVMSTNVLFSKVCWQLPAFAPQANFPTHNLNFHWRWRWWDRIQATFKNRFNFIAIVAQTRSWLATFQDNVSYCKPSLTKREIFYTWNPILKRNLIDSKVHVTLTDNEYWPSWMYLVIL